MADGERGLRLRASLWTQFTALLRKNLAFQKRRWGANLGLLSAPFLICVLLWVLQGVINRQLDTRDFRCGCKCLQCCDWVPGIHGGGSTFSCYNATDETPCSPYAKCKVYNDSDCGFLYSTAEQVGFCPVKEPPLWPALLEIPKESMRGPKYPEVMPDKLPSPRHQPSDAPMLHTGQNETMAVSLMAAMWARSGTITEAVLRAYLAAQAAGSPPLPTSANASSIATEREFVEATSALARGLSQFGLTMGTSEGSSLSLLMEPAFVAAGDMGGTESSAQHDPLYFAVSNCSDLSPADLDTLARIGEVITNLTGFPVRCASLPPTWVPSPSVLNDILYCGSANSGCLVRGGAKVEFDPEEQLAPGSSDKATQQEFVSALFDWRNTSAAGLQVTVYVNNSNVAREVGPPEVQRWNQPLNLATNAYLKQLKGPDHLATLVGVRDMPKGPSKLSLDFSSLLGPLFMMWFMQLLLPVYVHALVAEKEHHLRMMMKMQGLRDEVYYAVQYVWMLAIYLAYMAIFVLFGSLLGLKIFVQNSYSVQFVLYFLWGQLLASWSFYFSSLMHQTRTAVLLAVIWVIISGFMANLLLTQYIEQGPQVVATISQFIPSFCLFRGLYELAQYAFLADRNGGSGLTWDKLTDSGNDMVHIWVIMIAEWLLLPITAYYIEQVTGDGTGVRKHPLFFLGVRHGDLNWFRRRKQAPSSGSPAHSASLPKPAHSASLPKPAAASGQSKGQSKAACSVAGEEVDPYYGSFSGAAMRGFASPCLPVLSPTTSSPRPLPEAPAAQPGVERGSSHQAVQRKATSTEIEVRKPDSVTEVSDSGAQGGADVAAERSRVDAMWQDWSKDRSQIPPAAIILHCLRKVFPRRDGNAEKVAVRDLSLAIQRCECFGLLGPNGAGKTTTIRMMEGFMAPSSGQAIIEGYSIQDDMDTIYNLMGACPQHDLLWDGLTGREHLLFYGRIKNLEGKALQRSVDDALRSVDLFGVGDELVGGYSGGMKRRLSVAIALVGDPLVVYFDEPSTGLDPSSRKLLWDVIKRARRDKAVVLTTHSMEEAEALCDRLGIFVAGRLQCLGNPKDLTARFGGYLSFTITTPPHQEAEALRIVRGMSPGARLVYALGGTQKFELPLGEVGVDGVFRRMEEVKLRGEVDLLDWGVSNATLEEVFISVTRKAGVELSAFT